MERENRWRKQSLRYRRHTEKKYSPVRKKVEKGARQALGTLMGMLRYWGFMHRH